MSSSLRKMLGRRKRLKVKKAKGPASITRPQAPVKTAEIPKRPVDMSRANPSCKTCYGTGWGPTIVKGEHRTKLICACVSRGMTGDAPWIKGYVAEIDRAATELAEKRITKKEFEQLCMAAWLKEKGPVPAGRMLCVELRGEKIIVGHQPISVQEVSGV